MNFKPLWDRVVIKRLEVEGQTKSGLFIPSTAQEKSLQGVVVSIGKGRITSSGKLIETLLKPGDHVLFAKHAGTEIQLENEGYLIMREEDIMGTIAHPEDA